MSSTPAGTEGYQSGLRLALQYPARDRLVVVERPRHGHMRLDVGEAGARERAIRRHVERVGFTEESLDVEDVEIDRGGSPHTLRAVAGAASLRLDDVQVHVGLPADADLVSGREAERCAVELPEDQQRGALRVWPCVVGGVELTPAARRGQPG